MNGTKRRWLELGLMACVLSLLGGCYFQTLPDPNDASTQKIDPRVMQRNIEDVYSTLDLRVKKGEISEAQKTQMIQKLVNEFAAMIDVKTVPAKSAWRCADILRQAGKWEDAQTLLEKAVKAAPDDDRRVNDTLQLARVKAHLGQVEEGIKLVRSTFDVKAEERGPIMMSTLYEFVPEAAGKGKDDQVAKLLEDTIFIHQSVVVDPSSQAGKDFLIARPIHVQKAWAEAIKLFDAAKDEKGLRDAVIKQQDMAAQNGSM